MQATSTVIPENAVTSARELLATAAALGMQVEAVPNTTVYTVTIYEEYGDRVNLVGAYASKQGAAAALSEWVFAKLDEYTFNPAMRTHPWAAFLNKRENPPLRRKYATPKDAAEFAAQRELYLGAYREHLVEDFFRLGRETSYEITEMVVSP